LAGVSLDCFRDQLRGLGRGLTYLSDGGVALAVVRPPSYGVDELHAGTHPSLFLLGQSPALDMMICITPTMRAMNRTRRLVSGVYIDR
jgi:hypothetical protein